MPFKSEAQRKYMYANLPEIAKKWESETPQGSSLPQRINPKKPKSLLKTRRLRKKLY